MGGPLTLDETAHSQDQALPMGSLQGPAATDYLSNPLSDPLAGAMWLPSQPALIEEVEQATCPVEDDVEFALTAGSDPSVGAELPNPDPGGAPDHAAIGYALVTDSNALTRDADGKTTGARVPDGTFCELLSLEKKGKQMLAELRYTQAGAGVHVYTAASNLEGEAALPQSRVEQLKAEKLAALHGNVRGRTLEDLNGELGDPGSPAQDQQIRALRDRRGAALDGGSAPNTLMDSELSPGGLAEPYKPFAQDKGVRDIIRGGVREKANKAVFSSPMGQSTGESVELGHLSAVQDRMLERYAAGQYLLKHVDQVRDHWKPMLVKFEDGQDYKGLKALFKKKNQDWKTLRKNQRKANELPAVKWVRGLLKMAPPEGPALDEITWLVEGHDAVQSAIEAGLEQALSLDLGHAGGIQGGGVTPLPAPGQIQTAEGWKAVLSEHMQVLGAPPLVVESETRKRKLAPKHELTVNKVVRSALEEMPQEQTLKGEAEQALGRSTDWTEGWESQGEEGEVAGWLTVEGLPNLLELDMPIFGDLGASEVIGSVHLGDRLAWTGRLQEEGGVAWLQVRVGEGLGWVEARYTNGGPVSAEVTSRGQEVDPSAGLDEAQLVDVAPEKRDPAALFDPPPGLSVRRFMVSRAPGSLPVFPDVYAKGAEGELPAQSWTLHGETGPGSSARAELLVNGAPRYVPRSGVREAKEVDLLMNTAALDEAQLLAARDALAHDADLQAEPQRRADYHLRLLAISPVAEGESSSRSANRGELNALADALHHLGLPNPYPGHGYADALEMVRMEKGIAVGDTRALAVAAGASMEAAPDALASMGQGRSVLVEQGGQVLRAVGVDAQGRVLLDGPKGQKTVDADKLGTAWALGVPLESEGRAQALAALQAEVQATPQERGERWQTLYAETTSGQSAWYLAQLGADEALAEQGEALGGWLPTAEDVCAFVSSPDDKVMEVLQRHLAGSKGVDDAFEAGREWVQEWGYAQSGREELVQALIAELKGALGRRMAALARGDLGAAVAFIDQAEGLTVMGEPLGGEYLRDVLKAQLVVASPAQKVSQKSAKTQEPKDGGGNSKATQKSAPLQASGPGVQVGELQHGKADRGKSSDGDKPLYGDLLRVSMGGFSVQFDGDMFKENYGWHAGGEAATINGETFANLPSDEALAAVGLNETEIRLVRVRAQMEDGIGSDVNGYDAVYASFGLNQNTLVDESGEGYSNVSEMLGGVMYGEDGKLREGMEDIEAALSMVGLALEPIGTKHYGLVVTADEVLGPVGIQEPIKWTHVRDLYEANRVMLSRSAEPGQAAFEQVVAGLSHDSQNLAAFAVRTSPERLGVLSAIYADPRIQAACAVSWARSKLGDVKGVKVQGRALTDYPISERVAGVIGKLSNSLGSKGGKDIARRAFAQLVAAHPDAKETSWGNQAATYNSALEDAIVVAEAAYRVEKDKSVELHRAQDWLDAADELEEKGVVFGTTFQGQSGTRLSDIAGNVQGGTHLAQAVGQPVPANDKDVGAGAGWGGFSLGLPELTQDLRPLMLRGVPDLGTGRDSRETGLAKAEPEQSICVADPRGVLAEARGVPIGAVYGPELRQRMAQCRDLGREAGIHMAILKGLEQAPDLLPLLPDLSEGLAGLWERKRLLDLVGLGRVADEVDRYLIDLEKQAGHERAKVDGPASAYGTREYDEALAKQWMEELFEAYTQVPVTLTLAGGVQAKVQISCEYRNFGAEHNKKHNNDYLGLIDQLEGTTAGYKVSTYSAAILNGDTDDGVAHSASFLKAWQGKGTPEELQAAIQEAIATDPSLGDELAAFDDPDKAQAHLQQWLHLKLGLDCIGFAWNVINGSGMYDDFTPVYKLGTSEATPKTGRNSRMMTFACAGFNKSALRLDDPKDWRTMDCIVSDGHIIVIYDVQFVDTDKGNRPLMDCMESSGNSGVARRWYIWDGKTFRHSDAKGKTDGNPIRSGPYHVYRAENNAAVEQFMQNRSK